MRRRPALSRTSYNAALWLWPGQALFVGPSLRLGMHAGSVACLVVGIDESFTVRTAARELRARSALIPARLHHQLVARGRMAFWYVDPGSMGEAACKQALRGNGSVRVGHARETELVRLGALLHDRREHGDRWPAIAMHTAASRIDRRIRVVTRRLIDDPSAAGDASVLARVAGLSPSRFLHLFRAETGTTFRRYRLWARMLRAGAELARGCDLTTAAIAAGFASSAHFSSAFHRMFGLPPRQLVATGLDIVVAR